MNGAEGGRDGGGRRRRQSAEHGLVQLSPRAGRHAGQAARSTKAGSATSFTTAPTSCRTGRSPRTCRKAAQGFGGSMSSAAGSGVTGDLLAHCIDTAIWLNGGIDRVTAHDRNVHQGAQAHPHRQSGEGRHRRCLRVPGAVQERLAGDCSNRRATPAGTRRSTRSRSTAEHASIAWDLHDLHRLQYFDHRDEGEAARLASQSTSPTAIIPT